MIRTNQNARPASSRQRLTLLAASLVLANAVQANPSGHTVAAGSATVSSNGNELTITQHSQNAIINWQSFSNAYGEQIRFVQPSSSAAILNRVVGLNQTVLQGELRANGQVFLINPSGVIIAPGAVIHTGAFVASTRDVTDAQFMAGGPLDFQGDSQAQLIQQGSSITATTGDVLLIGHTIESVGPITAERGVVGMASGDHILVRPADSRRLVVQLKNGAYAGSINSHSTITAAQVELQTHGTNVLGMAVNAGGSISAIRFDEFGGKIWIESPTGSTNVDGQLMAQSGNRGGDIVINGDTVTFGQTAHANASGPQGGGTMNISANSRVDFRGEIDLRGHNGENGNLTLAAADIVITDNTDWISHRTSTLGSAELQSAMDRANVTIRARANGSAAGDLLIGQGPDIYGGHTFNNASNLTLQAERDITVNESIFIGNGTSSGDLRLQAGRHLTINNNNRHNNVSLLAEGNLSLFADVAHDGSGPGTMRIAPGASLFSNNIRLFAPGPGALTVPSSVNFYSWSSPDPRTNVVYANWSSIADNAPSGFYFRPAPGSNGAIPGTDLNPGQITTPVTVVSSLRGQHIASFDGTGMSRQERVSRINDPQLNQLMAELNDVEAYLSSNGERPPKYTHERASNLRKEIDNRLPFKDAYEPERAAYIAKANDPELNAWQANIDLLEAWIVKNGADPNTATSIEQLRQQIDRKIAVMQVSEDLRSGNLAPPFLEIDSILSNLEAAARPDAELPQEFTLTIGPDTYTRKLDPKEVRDAYIGPTISKLEKAIDNIQKLLEFSESATPDSQALTPMESAFWTTGDSWTPENSQLQMKIEINKERGNLLQRVHVLEKAIAALRHAQARNLL